MLAFLLVFLVACLIATVFAVQTIITLIRVGVPFVTVPGWVVHWLRENVHVPDGATMVDLGCGDGRVLIALARKFPTANFIGYDLNWWALVRARLNAHGLKNVRFERRDFLQVPLNQTQIVFCYLFSSVMAAVSKKLQAELPTGAETYSHAFPLLDWQIVEQFAEPNRPKQPTLLHYRQA